MFIIINYNYVMNDEKKVVSSKGKSINEELKEVSKLITGKRLYMVAVVLEGFFAIPVVGGLMIFSSAYVLLVVAFLLHLSALIFGKDENLFKLAPVFGMIASILGFIPGLGWVLHVITFCLYLYAILSRQQVESIKKTVSDVVTKAEKSDDNSSKKVESDK